ncbi:hypothetical protein [Pseudoxanthomonas sp. USHLN014]|uniref:hypothetical protein n=1 Tax=Pseudoxanthomonas sp. USHLN014 TaxID=3081297 RepID=UPI00301E1005
MNLAFLKSTDGIGPGAYLTKHGYWQPYVSYRHGNVSTIVKFGLAGAPSQREALRASCRKARELRRLKKS